MLISYMWMGRTRTSHTFHQGTMGMSLAVDCCCECIHSLSLAVFQHGAGPKTGALLIDFAWFWLLTAGKIVCLSALTACGRSAGQPPFCHLAWLMQGPKSLWNIKPFWPSSARDLFPLFSGHVWCVADIPPRSAGMVPSRINSRWFKL